jgi:hypothetical protein
VSPADMTIAASAAATLMVSMSKTGASGLRPLLLSSALAITKNITKLKMNKRRKTQYRGVLLCISA